VTKRRHPGISVTQRGKTWYYRLYLDPHPLTGERPRENVGGFATEDDAWNAALESQAAHRPGRHVKPSNRTVREFLAEWLATVQTRSNPALTRTTPTTSNAYVVTTIGKRRLRDVTVPVPNAFYRHLLQSGRRKPDNNTPMHEYWLARRDERNGLGPPPREIAVACKTTIHAARAAVARYQRGRIPAPKASGLAPKTVTNVHRMLHRAFKDAVAWDYLAFNPAEHASLPRIGRPARRRNRRSGQLTSSPRGCESR
jgi:hypothetical protein